MAFLKCSYEAGGGNSNIKLVITCAPAFAGLTITATDGSSTFSKVCPLTSPYVVNFENIAVGTWTVSTSYQGITYSTTITIIDFEATLPNIPDGATVLPINDIQIWLNCANIWDKTYTSLSEVLADSSTLQTVIASNNAVDYMARSTTWATDVCADQTAMSYIGLDDYCADMLLADSTWRTAICSSNYYEDVLTTKIPTMTSDSTPSGTASASSVWSGSGFEAYRAFDGNNNTNWATASGKAVGEWLQYTFTNEVKILKMYYYLTNSSGMVNYPTQLKIQAYYNGAWNDVKTVSVGKGAFSFDIDHYNIKSARWRVYCTQRAGSNNINIGTIQFYGRV